MKSLEIIDSYLKDLNKKGAEEHLQAFKALIPEELQQITHIECESYNGAFSTLVLTFDDEYKFKVSGSQMASGNYEFTYNTFNGPRYSWSNRSNKISDLYSIIETQIRQVERAEKQIEIVLRGGSSSKSLEGLIDSIEFIKPSSKWIKAGQDYLKLKQAEPIKESYVSVTTCLFNRIKSVFGGAH